jgi:hypothetical protein
MSPPTRRAFLGLAQGAVAVAALGALGVHFVGIAEAMSVPPGLGKLEQQSDLITRAQGGPPPPGWRGPRRRPRRRRWVCWWHRGRRRCGWRWF